MKHDLPTELASPVKVLRMNSESLEDASKYIMKGKFWFEKAWAWPISYTLPAKVSLGMVARLGGRDTYLKNYFYFESKTPE